MDKKKLKKLFYDSKFDPSDQEFDKIISFLDYQNKPNIYLEQRIIKVGLKNGYLWKILARMNYSTLDFQRHFLGLKSFWYLQHTTEELQNENFEINKHGPYYSDFPIAKYKFLSIQEKIIEISPRYIAVILNPYDSIIEKAITSDIFCYRLCNKNAIIPEYLQIDAFKKSLDIGIYIKKYNVEKVNIFCNHLKKLKCNSVYPDILKKMSYQEHYLARKISIIFNNVISNKEIDAFSLKLMENNEYLGSFYKSSIKKHPNYKNDASYILENLL